nr:MAG TPA: hypothetical protein [Caudoviricetes sp.]
MHTTSVCSMLMLQKQVGQRRYTLEGSLCRLYMATSSCLRPARRRSLTQS